MGKVNITEGLMPYSMNYRPPDNTLYLSQLNEESLTTLCEKVSAIHRSGCVPIDNALFNVCRASGTVRNIVILVVESDVPLEVVFENWETLLKHSSGWDRPL